MRSQSGQYASMPSTPRLPWTSPTRPCASFAKTSAAPPRRNASPRTRPLYTSARLPESGSIPTSSVTAVRPQIAQVRRWSRDAPSARPASARRPGEGERAPQTVLDPLALVRGMAHRVPFAATGHGADPVGGAVDLAPDVLDATPQVG